MQIVKIDTKAHKEQLKIGDLEKLIGQLKQVYVNYKELPIYLGRDDELNGIHTAWSCGNITEDDYDLREMINENYVNIEIKKEEIGVIIC